MCIRTSRQITPWLVTMVALILLTSAAKAFQTYSGCASCHPQFQNRGPLHGLHLQMTNTCTLCHISIGDTPRTYTSGAVGGQGCRGCHGVDNSTQFEWAAGLREHHRAAGVMRCLDCHTDSPSSILPESTRPVYYLRTDVNVKEPCSSAPPDGEDWDGDGQGLDNDGDLLYDEGDPDCSATGVGDISPGSPQKLVLHSSAPNPFRDGGVDIHYGVARASDLLIQVFDVAGRQVLEKRIAGVPEGTHVFHFDGNDAGGRPLISGIYIVRIESGDSSATGRIVLLR